MSLATIANVPDPKDENSFHEMSFSNMDSHRKIADAIFTKNGVTLSVYAIDPIPFFDLGVWFQNHQQMHNDMNGVTGVSGNDLSSVDFSDPEQAAYWTALHWAEHQQVEQKLGITS